MRFLGLVAALALSACAFSSEHPLFAERDAVSLFGDGRDLSWNERPDGDAFNIRFVRVGDGYDMTKIGDDDPPMRVLFVPIASTSEEDYVAQVRLGANGAGSVAYAFIWRTGDGYRVFADPNAFNANRQAPAEAAQFCHPVGQGECGFTRVADLLGYYRGILYPQFVRGDAAPSSYLDLGAPLPQDAAEAPGKTPK